MKPRTPEMACLCGYRAPVLPGAKQTCTLCGDPMYLVRWDAPAETKAAA